MLSYEVGDFQHLLCFMDKFLLKRGRGCEVIDELMSFNIFL